jgi:dienelactone hydrolase
MGIIVKFERPDVQSVEGFLAEPAKPDAPAVVVTQE